MAYILILRHAKSDWEQSRTDHDRPLTDDGLQAAVRLGEHLAAIRWTPDRILSSDARRARTTVEAVKQAAGWSTPIRLVAGLYETHAAAALEQISVGDDETLLIAGHEPTSSGLIRVLIGGGAVRMPTAGLACIQLPGGRGRELAGRGELKWLLTPKTLAP